MNHIFSQTGKYQYYKNYNINVKTVIQNHFIKFCITYIKYRAVDGAC